jgi:hypothetical protein
VFDEPLGDCRAEPTFTSAAHEPSDAKKVLDWCSRNTHSVKTVLDPDVLRELQRAVTRRLDGKPFAPTVACKTRSVLRNALDYAVELKLIDVNPLAGVKWTTMPKGKRKVDKRAVPNPIQARTLLAAVREASRSGERLEAFFGTLGQCTFPRFGQRKRLHSTSATLPFRRRRGTRECVPNEERA